MLEGFKPGSQRLSLNDINIPFDDVFQSRAACRQSCLDVFQNLFCLCFEVAFADDVSRSIYGVLPTDIDSLYGTRDCHNIRKSRVPVERIGIYIFDLSFHLDWL
jgi:hypothetical protein